VPEQANERAQFGYELNCLMDIENTIAVDA
jgi:hypothetical protein